MERMTEYERIGGHAHAVPTGNIDTALMRLAAYEDTGLEPDEVTALQKDWSDLCTIIGECGGIDRLRELARADKDGRVVELPNKPSNTITNADRMRNARADETKALLSQNGE